MSQAGGTVDDQEWEQPNCRWLLLSWTNCSEFIHQYKDCFVKAQIDTSGNMTLTMAGGAGFQMQPHVLRENVTEGNAFITHLVFDHGMFKGFENLQEFIVDQSDTLQIYLGDATFEGCTALVAVHLGRHCYMIPRFAFKDCLSLVTLNWWPPYLHTIGAFAFQGCQQVSKIAKFPESLKVVEEGAFADCPLLVDVTEQPHSTRNAMKLTVQCYTGSNELYFCHFHNMDIWGVLTDEHVCVWTSNFDDKFEPRSLWFVKCQNMDFSKCPAFFLELVKHHNLHVELEGCILPEPSYFIKLLRQFKSLKLRPSIYCQNCTLAMGEDPTNYCLSILGGLATTRHTIIRLFGVKFDPMSYSNKAMLQFNQDADIPNLAHHVEISGGFLPWWDIICEVRFEYCDLREVGGGRMLLKRLLSIPKLTEFSAKECQYDASTLNEVLKHIRLRKVEQTIDPEFVFKASNCQFEGIENPCFEILDALFPLQIHACLEGIEFWHDQSDNSAELLLFDARFPEAFASWLGQERDATSPNIRSVGLYGTALDSRVDGLLFSLIHNMSHLHGLGLSCSCEFGQSLLPNFKKALKAPNSLKKITIDSCVFKGEDLTSTGLLDDMLKLELEEFELGHYHHEHEFVATMCKHLSKHPTLKILQLTRCNLNDRHVSMILQALVTNNCLKMLNLGQEKDSSSIQTCPERWSNELGCLSHLEELRLQPVDSAEALWEGLEKNLTLTAFCFEEYDPVDSQPWQPEEAARFITRNKHLKNIRLGEFDTLPLSLCSLLVQSFRGECTVLYQYLQKSLERILPYGARWPKPKQSTQQL